LYFLKLKNLLGNYPNAVFLSSESSRDKVNKSDQDSNGEDQSDFCSKKKPGSQMIILGGIKKMQAISSKHVEQKIFILEETEDEFWRLVRNFWGE
jgi:hypothetical protein